MANICNLIVDDLKLREALGLRKYRRTLADAGGRDWLQEAYEEVLDVAFYLRKEIEERKQDDHDIARAEGEGMPPATPLLAEGCAE